MSGTISFSPAQVSVAPNTFSVTSDGFVQGTMLDDPAIRYQLAGGILAATETVPMWGGVAIYEAVPSDPTTLPMTVPWSNLGSVVRRATTAAEILGFSVFNQAAAWITLPQSPVPTAFIRMTVPFFRLGSRARIAVQCDPVLVSLQTGPVSGATLVSWDFASQMLVPYNAAYAANVVTASSWASTGGGQNTYTTTTAHGVGVGEAVDFSGFTPAGYNGHYIMITGTTGSTIVVANTTDPGTSTVQGSLLAGGGAVAVRVLSVHVGNSKVVNYAPATGLATWNNTGSCAVIEI